MHAVDAHDGFVDLEVWRSDRDAGEVLMVSRWRDRACFTAYMRSEDHLRSHGRIPEDLDAAIRLERLEHLHTYEVAPVWRAPPAAAAERPSAATLGAARRRRAARPRAPRGGD